MPALNLNFHDILSQGVPLLLLDLILTSLLFYVIFKMLRGTKAIPLLKGLGVLFIFTVLSQKVNLKFFGGLLQYLLGALMVALPILFQPELRRALEQLGQRNFFAQWLPFVNLQTNINALEDISRAAEEMADLKIGALIVMEGSTKLYEVEETGFLLDALVSDILIKQIFYKNTPLHDGAVLVRGARIAAAGCILPLTEEHHLANNLGTRHRAGLGLSEQSDAIVIIISEEKGSISVAKEGQLTRLNRSGQLLKYLKTKFGEERETAFYPPNFINRKMRG
ncbi:MAG TPA: TIGR00159 family protein [Firmicutes bacterium]|nr:TIGR00159 family protein [Bacillota bacterium]